MYATDFLQRLGLGTDADERAIKRAYARELKQIDQERDIAGFQLLREAYERALDWARHKPASPSFAPARVVPVAPMVPVAEAVAPVTPAAPVLPTAPPAPPRDNPQQLADAVFGEFRSAAAEIVAQGGNRDVAAWRKRLDACARDERLLNLSARAGFEFLVAHLLADGWQPGHEGLFIAARQVFGWDKDGRRLLEFGQLGAWLNQAIDESEMFTRQDSADCSGQAAALARVREPADPRAGELLTHVPHLRTLRARFPVWSAIIASTERIAQWIDAEQALPAWRRGLRFARRPRPMQDATQKSGISNWLKFFIAIMLIKALTAWMSSSSPPASEPARPPSAEELADEERYRRAAGALYIPPDPGRIGATESGGLPHTWLSQALPPSRPDAPADPAQSTGRFLNEDEMRAIMRRIDYGPPYAAPGKYLVAFELELGAAGQVEKLHMKKSSGLPVLDQKVEQAIRASAPFPPGVMPRMVLQFGHEYHP